MKLSSNEYSKTNPCLWRSSGIWPIPASVRWRTDILLISLPFNLTTPLSAGFNPVIASINSVCPFPSIPATPKISPSRNVNDKFLSASTPRAFFTHKFSTSRIGAPTLASSLSNLNVTLRPTIKSAKSCSDTSSTTTVPIPLPLRIIVQCLATALISFNLWVIIMIDFPSAVNCFMICIKCSISWGVKTAVGSSKIKISASRYNIFKISTRCCIPTEISSIFAYGSTCRL